MTSTRRPSGLTGTGTPASTGQAGAALPGRASGHPGPARPPDPDPVEVAIQLLATLLESRHRAGAGQDKGPEPMLTVAQTAALLGTSRATIIRRADAGELPCVILSRGRHQKMRRFPKALVEDLARHAGGQPQMDLGQHTARWLAARASRTSPPDTPAGAHPPARQLSTRPGSDL